MTHLTIKGLMISSCPAARHGLFNRSPLGACILMALGRRPFLMYSSTLTLGVSLELRLQEAAKSAANVVLPVPALPLMIVHLPESRLLSSIASNLARAGGV